jgi:hypothetical protein
MRILLGLVLASIACGLVACTDGRQASAMPEPEPEQRRSLTRPIDLGPHRREASTELEVQRNSDGSPQVLPPGPPSRSPYTIVLAYDDFGPQAMAFGLIGMDWWQWEGGGSWEPGDRFDVRVVVYRGMTLAAVEAEYPTVEGRADYRYVSFDDAMEYFALNMAEIEGEPSLQRLHEELAVTRARIRQALGAAAEEP